MTIFVLIFPRRRIICPYNLSGVEYCCPICRWFLLLLTNIGRIRITFSCLHRPECTKSAQINSTRSLRPLQKAVDSSSPCMSVHLAVWSVGGTENVNVSETWEKSWAGKWGRTRKFESETLLKDKLLIKHISTCSRYYYFYSAVLSWLGLEKVPPVS